MLCTKIKGSLIRDRRKVLRLTQSELLSKMITHGRRIGENTISLWERKKNHTLQTRNYLALCECLKIDPSSQKPKCILEDERILSMCSKLGELSIDARKVIYDIVDNITEDTIKDLQVAQTLINSRSSFVA